MAEGMVLGFSSDGERVDHAAHRAAEPAQVPDAFHGRSPGRRRLRSGWCRGPCGRAYFHDPPDKDGKVKKFAFKCHRRANADHPEVPRQRVAPSTPSTASRSTFTAPLRREARTGASTSGASSPDTAEDARDQRPANAPKELLKTNPGKHPSPPSASTATPPSLRTRWATTGTRVPGCRPGRTKGVHPAVNYEDVKKRPTQGLSREWRWQMYCFYPFESV